MNSILTFLDLGLESPWTSLFSVGQLIFNCALYTPSTLFDEREQWTTQEILWQYLSVETSFCIVCIKISLTCPISFLWLDHRVVQHMCSIFTNINLTNHRKVRIIKDQEQTLSWVSYLCIMSKYDHLLVLYKKPIILAYCGYLAAKVC